MATASTRCSVNISSAAARAWQVRAETATDVHISDGFSVTAAPAILCGSTEERKKVVRQQCHGRSRGRTWSTTALKEGAHASSRNQLQGGGQDADVDGQGAKNLSVCPAGNRGHNSWRVVATWSCDWVLDADGLRPGRGKRGGRGEGKVDWRVGEQTGS